MYKIMKNLMNGCFWVCMLMAAVDLAFGQIGWTVYFMLVGWFDMKIADKMEELDNASKSDSDAV